MRERNKYILKKGISDLPEHVAPESIWDNIETAIYDIPARTLPIHKAPSELWSDIDTGIVTKNSIRRIVKRTIIAALLLLITGLGIYLLLFDGITENNRNNISDIKTTKTENNVIEKAANTKSLNSKTEDKTNTTKKLYKLYEKKETPANNKPISLNTGSKYREKSAYQNNDMTNNDELLAFHNTRLTSDQSIINNKIGLFNLVDDSEYLDFNSLKSSEFRQSETPPAFDYCDFNRVNKDIYYGASVDYQYFIKSTIPENTDLLYWFTGDLRLKFKRNKLFFETGIGIGYSVDKTVFSYNYLTNELVDTYEYVDSVHFDPVTGKTEYFTTTVNVYDSIAYTSNSSVEKKYIYLHIPVFVGYEVFSKNDFAISLQAGVSYISQLDVSDRVPVLYHENSRITDVNSIETIRNTQFLNSTFAVGFGWNINRNVTLNVDPSFNYYFKNIYNESGSSKNSLSLGLKCGVYIKF